MKNILLFALLLGSALYPPAHDDEQEFQALVANAVRLSALILPGSKPFHMRWEASDPKGQHTEFNTQVELWWSSPDTWRREIKSQLFSQTAIQNGQHYSETNSSDYLPWWLQTLITESVEPLPLEELRNVEPDMVGPRDHRCVQWETEFTEGSDKIGIHSSVCFNSDGTVSQAFTRTVAATFADYHSFGGKRVPGAMEIETHDAQGKYVGLKARLKTIEPLKVDGSLFAVAGDIGPSARTRFVSVPQAALQDYKLDIPPMTWPVVHNFPATGIMTVNIKLDRNGTVREVGSPISPNVVLSDPAVEQVKHWKFKPFLVDGSPVQVNTDISIRFSTKVEMLGSNGAAMAVEPFLQRIKRSRELSDLHLHGSKPLHLHAGVQYADNSVGSYDEIWQAPTKWRREARLGDVTVTESQNGDYTYRMIAGSKFSPRQVDGFLDELDGHFPRTDGSFIEADWGQSAVQFHGENMVRVARGQVDANNQPITGQAYWFNSSGLLQAAYVEPRTSTYGEFSEWNGKQVPRKIEVTEKGNLLLRVTIDQIESPVSLSDSMFVLEGAKPEKIGDPDDYRGPALVQPSPLYGVKAVSPNGSHGTVVVEVGLDKHGHIRTAHVRQSTNETLNDAAIQAALQWEFTPMRVRGQIGGGFATIKFDF